MSSTRPPATRSGDPLVDGEVTAVPVVLGRHVGQRPLAGELERRHARRLVAAERRRSPARRDRVLSLGAMEALRTADEIRDVNTRYHDVAASSYDPKWGIDFGEVGRAQVLGKIRKLLGDELDRGYGRGLEIGAGTGYFSLNLLQAGVVREATCTDISPGMVATLAANARRLGLEVGAARADAESLPFADAELRPRVRPRGAPPPARPRARVHRVPSRAAPREGGSCSPASRRGSGTGWRACPSAAASPLAPAWRAGAAGAAPPPPRPARRAANATTISWSRSSTSTPSLPPTSPDSRAGPGFGDVRVRGEELLANWFGWFNRGARGDRRSGRRPDAVAPVRVPRVSAAAAARQRAAEPRLPPAIFYNLLLTARKR